MKTVRIAIVADLHANRYALSAFLRYLDRHFPAERILNLGDFLQIGPHPREVAEAVLGDPRFVSVLGNNELSLLHRNAEGFLASEVAHQDWTIAQLGPALLAQVAALPRARIVTVEGKRMLLLHSRTVSAVDRPFLYAQGRTLTDFTADYEDEEADWILFGHTHEPLYLSWRGTVYLNPGSLGCSRQAQLSFILVEMRGAEASVSLRSVAYDNAALKADYCERQVPDRERALALFHGIHLEESLA